MSEELGKINQVTLVAEDTDITNLQNQINTITPDSHLDSGQVVWSTVGLTYDISALTYVIQFIPYTAIASQVTLAVAPVSNSRIDSIYVDDAGLTGVITGVVAPVPVATPVDNATQLLLTTVTIAAGQTTPTLVVEDIYAINAGQPTEWNFSTDGTVVKNSTSAPIAPSLVNIETDPSPLANGKSFSFVPAVDYTITGGVLSLRLWAKIDMSGNSGRITVGFYNNGSLIGNNIILGGSGNTFGFDGSVIGVYQLVAINLASMGLNSGIGDVDELRFSRSGGGSAVDFNMANIAIQEIETTPVGVDATAVTYTPGTPGDWGTLPATAQEGLDELAATSGLLSVTNAVMLGLTPTAGTQVYNTTWLAVYTYDGDVWLTPNLVKAINGNAAAVMVEGNPVIQDTGVGTEVSFSLAPTSQDPGICGVVKDTYGGPGSVGDFVTIATNGEHNVRFGNAGVAIGDSVFNSGVIAGVAFSSVGFSVGIFGIARGAKAGGSPGLVLCWITPTERF